LSKNVWRRRRDAGTDIASRAASPSDLAYFPLTALVCEPSFFELQCIGPHINVSLLLTGFAADQDGACSGFFHNAAALAGLHFVRRFSRYRRCASPAARSSNQLSRGAPVRKTHAKSSNRTSQPTFANR